MFLMEQQSVYMQMEQQCVYSDGARVCYILTEHQFVAFVWSICRFVFL